jgi:2-aminoadipate transaminase
MASFYYTVPTFQNPTGVCYSLQRRKEIANVLNRVKTMLVEDDPYGQLYYDARPGNPICSYGVEKSMLLGTFSKMIAPGFRLGWLWTKSEAMRHLITAKQGADLCSSRFMQLLLLETLKKLDLDLHLAKVRDVYRRKREAMDMLMHKHLDGLCTWEKPKGGMFFWTKFNRPDFTATQLLKLCVSHGVAFADGSSFFANSGGSSFFRLNFTQSCDEEKDIGLGRLAEVLTSV